MGTSSFGRISPLSITTFAFVLQLLSLDHAETACVCNLTYELRQSRNELLENSIREHISTYLANQTTFLKSVTYPSFDLTSHLLSYTQENDTIEDLVLAGHIRRLDWLSFAKGSKFVCSKFNSVINYVVIGHQGTNTTKVYGHNFNGTTYYSEWVDLPTYLKVDCELYFEWRLRYYARLYNYPFGVYRQWLSRYFNFTGIDNATNPMKPCLCTPNASFAYRLRFSINSTKLDKNVCNITAPLEKLMQTDLELAVDEYASKVFGVSYIQSNFDAWVFNSNCSAFNMTLHFTNYYDENWNTSSSDIDNKMKNLTQLSLSYLDTELDVFLSPKAIKCTWFANGQNGTCISTSTTSTTIPTTVSSSTALSSRYTSSNINTSNIATTNTRTYQTFSMSTTMPLSFSTSNLSASTNLPAGTSPTSTHTFSSLSTTASLITTSSAGSLQSTSNQQLSTKNNGTGSTLNPNSNDTITNLITNSNEFLSNISIIPSQSTGSSPTSISNSTGNTATVTLMFTNNSQLTSIQTPRIVQTTTFGSTTNGLGTTFLPTSAASNATQGNRIVPANISNSSTTFDPDPFFKAEVPIVTKVYNDRYLFKSKIEVRGTYVTSQPFFYSIAIPALLGITVAVIILIVLCQIDWIGKPKAPKPT